MKMSLLLSMSLSLAPLAAMAAVGPYGLPSLPRDDFNRLAARLGLPLFWEADSNSDGVIQPAEVVVLGVAPRLDEYVSGGKFTQKFEQAYRALVEARRREAVALELDQGRPTLVASDLTGLSPAEKEFVGHIAKAADIIDALYLKQKGAAELEEKLPDGDVASRAMFHRNHGPWCVAPKTEEDPFCNALPDFPAPRWFAYPPEEEHVSGLCDKLRAQPNGKDLLAPFTVVRKKGDGYVALPLTEVYGGEMSAVAKELRAAAKAIHGRGEDALERYLMEAAKGFETNQWEAADEAWAAMNSHNSKWYLRIAPDEVYWDLCQEKAGFHVSFALIDPSSVKWQKTLTPLRDEMEATLAKLIGPPYRARKVSFHMPDFISIVINAGNSRSPLGATIGQSLPNWGKVAQEGRGRTVVMTNLYTDPDSRRIGREKAASLLDAASLALYPDDPKVGVVDIILHEATHNLGPHSDYRIDGKDPSQVFGGRLASTLEELKAQTGALYYVKFLEDHGALTHDQALALYTHSIVWAFGHISRGMFTSSGAPKTYSQLAAVQVGFFMDKGAMSWVMEADPETGKKVGKFHIDYAKMPAAIEELMAKVGRIKAKGDRKAGQALVDYYVSGKGKAKVHMDEIARRLLEYGKGSLIYSVEM